MKGKLANGLGSQYSSHYLGTWGIPLKPNDAYIGRTAPLTSRRCILYIYSINNRTDYFKHAAHSSFFLFKMPFVL